MRAFLLLCIFSTAFALRGADSAERLTERGMAMEKVKRYSPALVFYEAASTADPNYAPAFRHMGDCEIYMGNKPRALEAYRNYLRLKPDDKAIRDYIDLLDPPAPTPAPIAEPKPGMEAAPGPPPQMELAPLEKGDAQPFSMVAARDTTKAEFHWISLAELKEARKRSTKPVLYDFNAAWCGPCQMLKKQVFEDPKMAAWIGEHYIAVEVPDRIREDGSNDFRTKNQQLRFGIEGFPTLVIEGSPGGGFPAKVGFWGKEATFQWLQDSLLAKK